jgi:alkanesulfonate monooxygenase SsuD/methylene tetrahydromethanopterin reductase-like flavin-dependent oxidoreductase (luciferase family)
MPRFNLLIIPYMEKADRLLDGSGRFEGSKPEAFQVMLAEMRKQIEYADRSGYNGVCWTEQHLQVEGVEVNTSPIAFGIDIAGRTRNLKIGSLGLTLPTHNPLKAAEDVALLDHMSGGRAFCGFTRGNTRRWADTFAQHLGVSAASSDKSASDERNRELLEENWNIIKLAWENELFSFRGKYWTIPPEGIDYVWQVASKHGPGGTDENNILKKIGIAPRPLQKPRPPVYAPFTFSMTTAKFWAREGVNIVTFVPNEDFTATTIDVYTQEARAAGHNIRRGQRVALGAHLLVQSTEAKAQAYRDKFAALFTYAYDTPPFHVPMGRSFVGTGEAVRGHVEALVERHGVEEFFLWHKVNCFEPEQEMESLQLFAERVIAPLNR